LTRTITTDIAAKNASAAPTKMAISTAATQNA
jgi:hypothetical protein